MPRDVREGEDRVVHRAVRRVQLAAGGMEHALEGPQRRVPEFLGATGDPTHRVRGRPAPRYRQTEPEQRQVTRHGRRLCQVALDRSRVRMSGLTTLPTFDRGRSSQTSTCLGAFTEPMRSLTNAI